MHHRTIQASIFFGEDFWDPTDNTDIDIDEFRWTYFDQPKRRDRLAEALCELDEQRGYDPEEVDPKDHGNCDGSIAYYGGKGEHRIEITHPEGE